MPDRRIAVDRLAPPSAEDLRDYIGAAETPALLMLVAHVTDDVTVPREEGRPDPARLPQGGSERAAEEEIRAVRLARLAPPPASAAEWPWQPTGHVLARTG